jgi:hypothetical protein
VTPVPATPPSTTCAPPPVTVTDTLFRTDLTPAPWEAMSHCTWGASAMKRIQMNIVKQCTCFWTGAYGCTFCVDYTASLSVLPVTA